FYQLNEGAGSISFDLIEPYHTCTLTGNVDFLALSEKDEYINSQPKLNPIPDITLAEKEPLSITLTARDPDAPTQTLSYYFQNICPQGMQINSTTGRITWTPTESQGPDHYTITVRVKDNGPGQLFATQIFGITVTEVDIPPEFTVSNCSVDENTPFSYQIIANDPDVPSNQLSYLLIDCPTGLTITETGLIHWFPSESDGPDNVMVTIRVVENSLEKLFTEQSFEIQVNEINSKPVFDQIVNQTINENEPFHLTFTVTDADIPFQTLHCYIPDENPSGVSMIPNTCTMEWTPDEAQGPGLYTITVAAKDDDLNSLIALNSFNITVNEIDTPPEIMVSDQIIEIGQPLSFNVQANDYDIPSQDIVLSLVNDIPDNLIFDPESGICHYTPTVYEMPGVKNVTFRATADIASEHTISITLTKDMTLPVAYLIKPQLRTNTSSYSFGIRVSEPIQDNISLTVKDADNQACTTQYDGFDNNAYWYTIDLSTASEGRVSISAQLMDVNDNPGACAGSFIFDQTPPEIDLSIDNQLIGLELTHFSVRSNEILANAPAITITDASGTIIPVVSNNRDGADYNYSF
ncbi:MAG: hypothetical protein OMM_12505, partial [Candidatus Magnetoglobus multicellularis str. Araruama]